MIQCIIFIIKQIKNTIINIIFLSKNKFNAFYSSSHYLFSQKFKVNVFKKVNTIKVNKTKLYKILKPKASSLLILVLVQFNSKYI